MPDEYYNSIYTGEEIDRRLGLAGEVANAVFFDTNATGLWESGAISSSSGSNSSSTTRIRTAGYIGSGVKSIHIAAGYKYMVFGYNAGTYMGTWNGSSFVKSGNWRTTDLDLTTLPAYDLRLVMATSPTDSTISTVAASNIALLAATDTTLTASGIAADAKAAGDEIWKLKVYQPASYFTGTHTLNGIVFGYIDDYNIKIYGQSTASGVRFVNVFNGSAQTLNTSSIPTKCFPAGTYRFHVGFTGPVTDSWLCIIPNTTTSGTIRIEDGATYELNAPFAVGIRIPTTANWGTVDNPTFLYFMAEALVTKSAVTVVPTGDQTDRTNEVLATLKAFGKCTLARGEFFIENLQMPPYSTLEGSGKGTIIRLPTGSTASAVKLARGCAIRNVRIIGTGGESYEPTEATIGASHGVSADGISGSDYTDRLRITIENIEVAGFTGAGIYLNNTGENVADSCSISGCVVHNCNCGIYTKTSEYHRVSNSSFIGCYYGAYDNGGNNVFSTCGFNGNQIGCYIENIDGTSTNNTHGTFSACTFNHSHDIAIKLVGGSASVDYLSSGEVFQGCHIAFGHVEIDNARGVNFSSCNFLRYSPIIVGGGGFTMFNACVFIGTDAEYSPVTKTGSGALLFNGCYTRSATPFNPI